MVELVDTSELKSDRHCACVGSSPTEATIFKNMNTLKPGDKVCKYSGKPFRCGFKTVTVKDLAINPYTEKQAVVISEDDSVIDLYIIYKV